MLERLLVAGAVLALVALAVAAGRAWYGWRNRRIDARLRAEGPASGDGPRIIYFTTQTCVVCKAQQEPAIEALRKRVPDVVVERHDAIEDRELANRYGVLTVPTTAVYGPTGELVGVNRGFAPASVLLAQVRGDEPAFEGGAPMSGERLN